MRSGSFTLDSVQVGVPDENGDVQLADATQATFDFKWREKGGPGTQSYAVDAGRSDFYFYVYGQDEQVVMQMDYTIKAGVTAYKDCADLYWQYIGSDWKAPTYNVTCTISLPVPGGVTPVPGDTVYAWGHGPANGTLAFNDAATTVTYHADYVPAHEAETARVLFPRTWLTSISADDLKAHGSVTFKDQILKSEAEWADGGSYQYGYWLAFSIAIAAAPGAPRHSAIATWPRPPARTSTRPWSPACGTGERAPTTRRSCRLCGSCAWGPCAYPGWSATAGASPAWNAAAASSRRTSSTAPPTTCCSRTWRVATTACSRAIWPK